MEGRHELVPCRRLRLDRRDLGRGNVSVAGSSLADSLSADRGRYPAAGVGHLRERPGLGASVACGRGIDPALAGYLSLALGATEYGGVIANGKFAGLGYLHFSACLK